MYNLKKLYFFIKYDIYYLERARFLAFFLIVIFINKSQKNDIVKIEY